MRLLIIVLLVVVAQAAGAVPPRLPIIQTPGTVFPGAPRGARQIVVDAVPLAANRVYVRPSRTQPSANGIAQTAAVPSEWTLIADHTPLDLTFPIHNVPDVPNYDFMVEYRGWFVRYQGVAEGTQPGMLTEGVRIYMSAGVNPGVAAAVGSLALLLVVAVATLHRRARKAEHRLESTLEEMQTIADGKAMDLEVPRLIGRTVRGHSGEAYRTLRYLGAGNMGAVFEVAVGDDDASRRRWALKVPFRSVIEDAESRRRFLREAEICRRVPHAGLVQIFDWGTHEDAETRAMIADDEGWPFLVMEMMPGRTLRDVIDESPQGLPLPRVLEWLAQMVAAVKAMHEAGVVHRDLKPENMFITPSGRVKIGDFGIAGKHESHSVTTTGEILGTPLYMSPEHLDTQSTTPASDIYSLGVVGYEMLCGRTPFEAESVVAVINRMLNEAPAPISSLRADVPPALETLILSMMARNAARRPTAQRVLASLSGMGVRSTGTRPDR